MLVGPDGGPSRAGGASAVADPPAPAPAPPKPAPYAPPDRIDRDSRENTATAGIAGALPHLAAGSTYVDKSGAFENVANGKLPPSVTIQENGYTFKSDAQGRVASAEGRLATAAADPGRSSAGQRLQREVGWDDRLKLDHGGHLIGHRFGGPEALHNLFAQDGNSNTGEYKKLENSWAKNVEAGHNVDVKVQLQYGDDGVRPTHVSATTRINGGPPKVRVFENTYKGGLEPAPAARAAANDAESASRAAKVATGAESASKLARGAEVFGKVAAPVAIAADGYSLYSAYREDGDRIGKHTVEQAGSVAGGWAGAAVGAEAGAEGGAAVGALFGGVGAVPGAVIGGAVGGIVGGVVGSGAGKEAVKLGEGAVNAGKSAVHKVASFFGL